MSITRLAYEPKGLDAVCTERLENLDSPYVLCADLTPGNPLDLEQLSIYYSYCYRARPSCGGEAVYPRGCKETATLLFGIEVLGCPQGEAVSVGAGGHLSNLLRYGMVSAACTCC